MSHIFISYSHSDYEYTLKLANELRRQNFSIWIDERIPDGSRWFREIANAIRDCVAMIVIMTPEAEQSEWVEKEILLAYEEGKPIFPLLLGGKRFAVFINIQSPDVSGGKLPPENFFSRLPKESKNEDTSVTLQDQNSTILYPQLIQRWSITKSLENEGRRGILLGDAGKSILGNAWEIQTPDPQGRGTYGPYISLLPNKYQVTFRLKVDDVTGEDGRLAIIDATSRAAQKDFARKTLTVRDFRISNVYEDFNLFFELPNPDEDFEFRIRTNPDFEVKRRLIVDYIELRSQKILPGEEALYNVGIGQLLTRGEFRLNSDNYQLQVGNNVIQLTATEYRIMHYFMEHPNRVLLSSELLQAIWEYPPDTGDPDLVRAHVRNLNSKLDRISKNYIRAISPIGWILET